jgi:hypothetical protein
VTSATRVDSPRHDAVAGSVAAGVGVVSALYLWCSYTLVNDHFGRITPAWHIRAFGEVPFRDFLDPGFFLTLYSSAFVQWLFGHNLLGEALLNVACMAVGYAFAFRLAARGSGSIVVGLAAVAAAVVVTPRAYDYDKVLFYPAGLYACWRYLDRPTPAALVLLAMAIALGGLFRYDTAVFLGLASMAGLAARHWGDWVVLGRRLALLAALVAAFAAPVLLYVQVNGGLTAALDQVVTYARREGARTRVFQVTPLRLDSATSVGAQLGDPVVAATLLSYTGLAVPVATLLTIPRLPRERTAARAQRLSAAVLVAVTTLVIVRDPVLARVGAVMPIIAALAAVNLADPFRRWAGTRAWTGFPAGSAYRAGTAAIALVLTLVLSASATALARRPATVYLSRARIAELARTPPSIGLASRYQPLVDYLRACTRPADRVLATWFAPELYFYGRRGFAAGLPVMFGGHWSEDRFERRILRRLEAETVPLVIMRFVPDQIDIDYVREVWPYLGDHVMRQYEVAAVTNFGASDLTYQIWARRGMAATGRYGPLSLPCYGEASER